MYLTIITDCSDANAQARQETRVRSLFEITPSFVAVSGTLNAVSSLEVSGNIIDILDAAHGEEGIILASVAPQNNEIKEKQGTLFGYVRYNRSLIITTCSGSVLSLPHKFGLLMDGYECIDMSATVTRMWEGGLITEDEVTHIQESPFGSFDFLPRVAAWIANGHEAVTTPFATEDIPVVPPSVWSIDSFGNVKTTLLGSEVPSQGSIETKFGTLPVMHSLREVPNGTAALVVGSSGLGKDRFMEIVLPGGNAAVTLGIVRGDTLLRV
jgi:S-adenosyl-l-methionine hydroxide adenosyltransferase